MATRARTDGRAERSRRTRERVVSAAAALFVERGYIATTIEDVAAAADVAVQTVYYLFGNKRTLLASSLDATIAGDLEPVPIVERPWVDELRSETDAVRAVTQLVHETLAIVERVAPLSKAVREAAADPEVATLLHETNRRRHVAHHEFIRVLERGGHLRNDIDIDRAVDIHYSIVSEEVYELFVGQCGWSPAEFRAWATPLVLRELAGIDDATAGAATGARRRTRRAG